MKQLASFIKKELLHVLRDTWTMLILLALPIVMMILFGYAVTTEIKNTHFTVLDYSKDNFTTANSPEWEYLCLLFLFIYFHACGFGFGFDTFQLRKYVSTSDVDDVFLYDYFGVDERIVHSRSFHA